LRIDKLQKLNASTSRPDYDVEVLDVAGDHAPSTAWIDSLASSAGTGAPRRAWPNGRLIYWDPLPDATYTVRWYGFQAAADLTASGTFTYVDLCLLPVANFAVRLIRTGLDDATDAYIALAKDVFEPVVNVLGHFRRVQAPGVNYTCVHTT
jgi:hypothetical protein